MSEKVPKRTINYVIKRAENCIRAKRKLGRRRIAKKNKKKGLKRFKKAIDHSDKLSQPQTASQSNIYQGCVCKLLDEYEILFRKTMDILARAEQQKNE